MDCIEKSRKMINRWIQYSMKDLYTPPERQDLVCYGTGYNGWGMQTHQKGLAAYGIAATTDMETDIPKAELLDISLKMLRYMLESHIEGSYYCVEGEKWGHTWISVLGTERVMHTVDRLIPYLNEADKELLQKVLVSEADWILEEYPVEAEPVNDNWKNKPESNLWNGAFLHRVSCMYPSAPNADRYKKKGNIFLVNSISLTEDQNSEVCYDGNMVKDLYIGNNFFDSYSLDHHGYLNVGYMVITLSNIAMYHFACKINGFPVPQALYHRVDKLWQLVKSCMFADGRLIRIGGDTRVRYCYCQDYAIPMLLFAEDYLGDQDAAGMISGIVDMYEKEMENNGDGSFLSERCRGFQKRSPIYYTRLESDRADVLSMLINWEAYIDMKEKKTEILHTWKEAFHGAYLVRGEKRFASWVVSGATGPLALCLPVNHSDLAEWNNNLIGRAAGAGACTSYECVEHQEKGFTGGFAAKGTFHIKTTHFLAEQQKDEIAAKLTAVCVALPDDATMVVMQYAVSPQRIYVMEAKGILLNVPNDVYNDKKRTYYYDGESHLISGVSGKEECLEIKGNYINVDDILSVYGVMAKRAISFTEPEKERWESRYILTRISFTKRIPILLDVIIFSEPLYRSLSGRTKAVWFWTKALW